MIDIYKENRLYPHRENIKEHFSGFYDSVFIALQPFFTIDGKSSETNNFKKAEKITFQQAQENFEFLKGIPGVNAEIFAMSNKDYPTDIEVLNNGKSISWSTVINGAGLNDYKELNTALLTSIDALRPVFARQEFTNKINTFSSKNKIWHPIQGCYNLLSKVAIYNTFKLFEKKIVVIIDEDYETTKHIDIDTLTELEFIENITTQDFYIFSMDKEILFTIDWDSFFFIIAADHAMIEKIIEQNLFEGFPCDNSTTHQWNYEPEELQRLLKIESDNKKSSTEKKADKKWWKIW